jgi:hypothetical protein
MKALLIISSILTGLFVAICVWVCVEEKVRKIWNKMFWVEIEHPPEGEITIRRRIWKKSRNSKTDTAKWS